MRMKLRNGISFTMVLILVLALGIPAFAGPAMMLDVNGEGMAGAELIVKHGTTLVSTDTLGQLTEVDVQMEEQSVVVGEQKVSLSAEPVRDGQKTYVPLRFVAEKLGFQVNWVPGQVSLIKEQLKADMTAMDVLVKSNEKTAEINTYAMSGSLIQNMAALLDGEMEDFVLNVKSDISALIQSEPMQIYMTQKTSIPMEGTEMEEEIEMETYLDEEFMYMKMPGRDEWLKQPHFLPMEVLKEQQELNTDPLRAVEQMLEMGMAPIFDEDMTIDGKDYYVVKTAIDMSKVMESQEELLQQIMGSVGGVMDSIPPEEMETFSSLFNIMMAEVLENGDFDYNYTMYIAQETLLPELLEYEMILKMDLDVFSLVKTISEAMGEEIPAGLLTELPANVKLDIAQKAEFKMFDFGKEFVKPDLSKVTTFEIPLIDELMQEEAETPIK